MATSTPTNKNTDDSWLGHHADPVPLSLKVLTVLTFIWSGISVILSIWGFAAAQSVLDAQIKNQPNLERAPEWARKMAGPHPVETARAMLDNRLPILIIGLLGTFLCFFGALQMRKLKKTGFSIYVLGDIVPFATGIFIGFETFTSFTYIFFNIIAIVFIILYAGQLKNMK